MTDFQKRITILKQLDELGVKFFTELTVYYPEPYAARQFFDTFGLTKQQWVPSTAGDFRSVEVGKHINIYLDGHREEIECDTEADAVALNDPISAISLAYSFFGPEQVGLGLENAFKIRVSAATAEQAVQVMQLFDAEVETHCSDYSGKWISYGPVAIFFDSQEQACLV